MDSSTMLADATKDGGGKSKSSPDPCQLAAACLYCDGHDYRLWLDGVRDRLGFVPGEWAFVICQQCGAAILSPTPRGEEIAAFYPPVYTFSPELAKGNRFKGLLANLEYRLFFQPSYRAQAKIVSRYCQRAKWPGRRLLDIGCGRGLRLLEFQRHGFDVHGCDFSEEAVDYLQTAHGIPAKVGDLAALDTLYEPESFDIVTGFYVLEHVTDFRAVVKSCFRVLKPGGVLAVSLPLVDSTQAFVLRKRWASVSEAPRHISIPSQKALKSLIKEVGFRSDSVELWADATLANAGVVGLSLLPGSATSNVYGGNRIWSMVSRLFGAAAMIGAIPWSLADKWLFQRPGLGIAFAQKP